MAKYVEWIEFLIFMHMHLHFQGHCLDFHTFVASTFQKGNKYLVKIKEHEKKMFFQNLLAPFQNAVDFQWWFDRNICWLRLIWDWSEIDLRLIWDWSEIWPVLAQNLQINLEAKRIALCHCACPKRQFCPWFLPRSCKTKTRDMQYPLGAFNNYVDKKRRVGGQ